MVRHPIADSNESSLFGTLTADEFYTRHSVSHDYEFVTNRQGLKLFTQWWIPLPPTNLIGCLAIIHGYTGQTSWVLQLTAVLFAKHGFATCAIDHRGHGFSEGLTTYIPDINLLVEDCLTFFDSFRRLHVPSHLPSFIYGESLGGAMALLVALRQRRGLITRPYDGIVFNCTMFGICKKFKPPWPLEYFLTIIAALVPTWRIVPTRYSIPDVSFKVGWKRKLILANPTQNVERPRAGTAREIVRLADEIKTKFEEVELPFLVVHGSEDIVCDPATAEEFYRRASSVDKTMIMYPGVWHQMVGEEEKTVNLVFGDIVDWLVARAKITVAKEL
ncbi:caffeoylshikimate esterase-like [Impatiens glandulifera]|uniref:caffeoylshikimate esterase-like n=1 Tax=Impatiens glandulifera TaxID=253017 RepID=UPI001FB0A134|nr:caffeoylshikimate esterase-like [Impatiens glandulifera]